LVIGEALTFANNGLQSQTVDGTQLVRLSSSRGEPGTAQICELMRRQRAISSLAESFTLQSEGVVEPRPIILPGNGSRELHQLRVIEGFPQSREELIRHFHRRARHDVSIGENQLFDIGEHRARRIVGQSPYFFFGNAMLSADGRPDINSKRTAHQSRHPQ